MRETERGSQSVSGGKAELNAKAHSHYIVTRHFVACMQAHVPVP